MNIGVLITVLVLYFAAMIGIGLKGNKKYGQTLESKISANKTVGMWLFMGAVYVDPRRDFQIPPAWL
ncbi:MAG: hypothetical protein MJ059_08460 [Lachnospiraceae bacterium]|nr:hypothetical protein [Lachnospiraceae bacterium]